MIARRRIPSTEFIGRFVVENRFRAFIPTKTPQQAFSKPSFYIAGWMVTLSVFDVKSSLKRTRV